MKTNEATCIRGIRADGCCSGFMVRLPVCCGEMMNADGMVSGDVPMLNQWQPIATAPRDGTRILIWAEAPATGERRTYMVWWAIPYESAPDERGWWECDLWGGHHPVVPQFTHGWMPLPDPPQPREQQ